MLDPVSGGPGLGNILSTVGDTLSAPRRALWSALGLPEQGNEAMAKVFGMDSNTALSHILGGASEVLGDPLVMAPTLMGAALPWFLRNRLGSSARAFSGGTRNSVTSEVERLAASYQAKHEAEQAALAGVAGETEQAALAGVADEAEAGGGAAQALVPQVPRGTPTPTNPKVRAYRDQVGMMGDAMRDLLGGGTLQDRLTISKMGEETEKLRPGFLDALPTERPPVAQLRDLAMRGEMAATERQLPRLMGGPSHDLGQIPVEVRDLALNATGQPLTDSFPARSGIEPSHATLEFLSGNLLDRTTNPAFNALSRKMAAARMGSPELREAEGTNQALSRLLSRGMEDLPSPGEVAALSRDLPRTGVPVDPQTFVTQYRDRLEGNLGGDVQTFQHLITPRAMEVGDSQAEVRRTRMGNALLRVLGPERMQQLASLPARQRPDALARRFIGPLMEELQGQTGGRLR